MHISNIILGIPIELTPCPVIFDYFADHDFHFEFPSPLQGQYSSVNTDGDTTITAFTICVWLKTSDVSQIGLLRYSDQSGSNVLIALSLSSTGRLFFSLLDEYR